MHGTSPPHLSPDEATPSLGAASSFFHFAANASRVHVAANAIATMKAV